VIKARTVRHFGARFRAASLARHIRYLQREGVTRDGSPGSMFDARSEQADVEGFATRCQDDRHHFRFIVSPEDAAELTDLRAFTRELMDQAERDLGTRLDWVAIDHWNTDNPHLHLLVRGRADDGSDLVISRDYIGRGLRARAQAQISLELGPRSDREIDAALWRDAAAERWTRLDRALRDRADDAAGLIDLRPGDPSLSPGLRNVLIARLDKLAGLGLAQQQAVGRWTMAPNAESTLHDLSTRSDIIKTLHRAMSQGGDTPDVGRFAIHQDIATDPILGKLVERGLHDELTGGAYAVIDGVDGRQHHLRFGDLADTSDAAAGSIVALRQWTDDRGGAHQALAVRSDLTLEAQITASGATWLDRQLVSKTPIDAADGFGAAVTAAMAARRDHLVAQGHAQRRGERTLLNPELLKTLRREELAQSAQALAVQTGLAHAPISEGGEVLGVYRRRLDLASGRFAMIDDGLGFALVPWRPALEAHRGGLVRGVARGDGGVDWSLARQRGLGL